MFFSLKILLPIGSDEREVFLIGSIPVALLPSCQCMHEDDHSWVVKIRNTSEAVLMIVIHAFIARSAVWN